MSKGEGAVELYHVVLPDGSDVWAPPEEGKPPKGYSGEASEKFSMPWNYLLTNDKSKRVWSADEDGDREIGSYFSVQGFDLNYVGVIIGPSVTYRDGRIKVDVDKSRDGDIKGPYAEQLIIQQLKVLLRRGMHGLYLFAVDSELQEALATAARESGCYVQ